MFPLRPAVAKGALCQRHSKFLRSTRQASTFSDHPFPFPRRKNPNPHEIFHLPCSASQDEIKARYYELVKVYHPDAVHSQHDVSPSVRNARFRAITHAYGILRGRNRIGSGRASAWDHYESRDDAIRAELRHRSRRSRTSSSMAADSIRHENTDNAQLWYVMAFVLAGIFAAMNSVGSHMDRVERHTQSAAANLAQARAEAQVYGMERRRKIRELVRSFHDANEPVDDPGTHDVSNLWKAELSHGEAVPEGARVDRRKTED